MKLTCAFCGRDTEPAVMIGNRAIGPKCAAKAGLLPVKPSKKHAQKKHHAKNYGETLDLFGDQNEDMRRL